MSQRVTLDDTDMRARLRSHSHVQRPSRYIQRPIVISHTAHTLTIPSAPTNTAFAKTQATLPSSRPEAKTSNQPAAVAKARSTPAPKGLISDFSMMAKKPKKLAQPTAIYQPLHQPKTNLTKLELSATKPQPTAQAVKPKLSTEKQSVLTRQVTESLPKRQESSKVLMRQALQRQQESLLDEPKRSLRDRIFQKPTKSSVLMAMAVTLFAIGSIVSFMGFRNNTVAHAQETRINKQIDAAATTSPDAGTPPAGAPSTSKVSTASFASYKVAPDLARYIKISKIGVNARVLQVGVTKDGALGTPANVFDTAWYNASAKPGQPGATLIDGHVSSWTSNGVFYSIKKLVAGDTIQIQKGDDSVLTYSVVKTVLYDADNVDMQSLVEPVQPGKSGLNLITCGGKYDSKSGEFTQRVAVYAVLQ